MTHPVQGVDHVFLLVSDLEASAAAYRRLGFTLSPRGLHSAAMGSANHTIVFEHDYFELLGMVAETPGNRHHRDMLARDGEGLRAIACRIADARAAREGLATLGIGTSEVREFSRPLPLPDGSEGVAAFAVTEFAPADTPAGFMFMCEHRTPEMVWRPELKAHPNGARGLAGIVAVADDPEALAGRFARLFALGAASAVEGGCSVATGQDSAAILCLTPEAAGRRYAPEAVAATSATGFAALQVAVADLGATREVLEAAGVAVREGEGSVWVAPADGSGAIVEFVAR